jgi:ferredoxin-NADP reductase
MELIFRQSKVVSGDVGLYEFAPTQPLIWEAGQSLRIELATLYGPEDHRFTIASIARDGTVAVLTRQSNSLYKQALAALQPGTIVRAYGLEGTFVWGNHELPRVFIAAGVGVSPFYAMLHQRLRDEQSLEATLLYSSRDTPIPWQDEMQQWQITHPELQLHFFPHQRLSGDLIHRTLPDISHKMVYVSGPTRIVDIISASLLHEFRLPEAQLLRDWFTGQLSPEG